MPSEVLFPHLTSTGPAPSYREVASVYRNVFSARAAEGVLRPLVLPYHLYGGFLLMLYLCIPHTKNPLIYAARWPVLAVILWFEWKTLWETSSMSPAIALACGLTSAWGAVWSVTWLVFYRPQWDAKRVQRMERRGDDGYRIPLEGGGRRRHTLEPAEREKKDGGGPGNPSIEKEEDDVPWEVDQGIENLRKRTPANSQNGMEGANGYLKSNGSVNGMEKSSKVEYGEADNHRVYYWQSYPDNLRERIPWVTDLIMNFRGPGWNWAIPPLPGLPQFVKLKLEDPISPKRTSPVGNHQYTTRRELFYARVPQFVIGYFILDMIKVVMMKDPYFIFGPTTYALPPHLANLSALQLRIYREIVISIVIIVSLQMTLSLIPIFMCLLLGPKVFGLRAEPWYFPSVWGSFSNITDKGLNGLWGGWWHQTFRFAFSAPLNHLIHNGYVKAGSASAKLLGLLFAFGISGLLHSWGSITQLPKTYPWHAPIFFMLQALGIFIQTTTISFAPGIKKLPKLLRQTGNILFTSAWLLGTGWLLVDDFSRGGIWLYEPIPISPLQGLGFGVEGDGWWCWEEHGGVGWYTGKHWWESGIAL